MITFISMKDRATGGGSGFEDDDCAVGDDSDGMTMILGCVQGIIS